MTEQKTTRRTARGAVLLAGGALTALLAGCGGGSNGGFGGSSTTITTPTVPTGGANAQGMKVVMHDTPALYNAFNLTLDKVTAVDGSGNEVILTSTPQTFDVLTLQNGATRSLALDSTLPAGTYTQVRLYLSGADVMDSSNADHTLTLPAAPNNYIKVGGSFTVSANALTTVSLDFDVAHSVGLNYSLTPVVRVDPPAGTLTITGSVTGTLSTTTFNIIGIGGIDPVTGLPISGPPVPTTNPLAGVPVRVYPAGQTEDATVPAVGAAISGADGTYTISGLPAGSYDLVITEFPFGSHTITNVTVTSGGTVTENYAFPLL